MGKFGLVAIGIAAIGLYLLLGDDDTGVPQPASKPPVTQQSPAQPAPAVPGPYRSAPEWEQDRYAAPPPTYDGQQRPGAYPPAGGYPQPLAQGPGYDPGSGYRYAPGSGYRYAPGSGYPTAGPAPAPAYQYRPLEDSEKQRLEQQYPGGYPATLDPYSLPPRGGPGLAGMPSSSYAAPRPEMSPGYAGSPSVDPYAAAPASGAYAPNADPYAAPQPVPGYGTDGWARPGVPNYGGAAPYPAQTPEAGYGFRPLDSARPDRRWRDSYSTPPAYSHPQHRPSGNPRSPDWPSTAPGQRGTSADAGPLWAAREFWN